VKGSRDLVLEFLDALHILGTVEVRNFKSGGQIDHKECSPKMFLRNTNTALLVV